MTTGLDPAGSALCLPRPSLASAMTVGAALSRRRSVRDFAPAPLSLAELGDLLWAAQGLSAAGRRTAPSAGATYPIEVYVVAGAVVGLPAGVHHYLPPGHALVKVASADRRPAIAAAAVQQEWLAQAPAVLAIAADEARTAARYGAKAGRYVAMEVGCVAENVALAAVSLGLVTVVVGAFDAVAASAALCLPRRWEPLCLMPVGRGRPG